MLPSNAQVTGGLFCDTAPLTVSNGQVWAGLFCQPGEVIIQPPIGGGGSGPGVGLPGENYFNQAPPIYRDPLLLEQALQEDEEMLLMIKAFVETIQ
jgi:hypothetical protein